ncbi:MAG TPA: helix-turn-helix transcriptional regulator [Candidatus Eisenbacteria bacterium]|nr:helix-turn-helix transcriptional regulator [Candidatus Eisenbacteria bacterium]
MDQVPRPNPWLQRQRRLHGWSQEDVAAGLCRVASALGESALGVDATTVSRWERGIRHPRPRYVRLLSQLFDLSAEELGLVHDAEPPAVDLHAAGRAEGDDAEGRDWLERMASALGQASRPPFPHPGPPGRQPTRPEPWQRLDWALGRAGRFDSATVDELERVTHGLESLEPTGICSRALLGPATAHLDAIAMLLQAPLPSGIRSRLCSLAGETAGLAGWLRWNLDDPGGASACFRSGLRAAREAGDRALGAYLVGAIACRLPGHEAPAITLSLLGGRAFGLGQADASPATGAWLAAKEAGAWAQLGREDSCLRALDRAAEIVERLPGAGHEDVSRPRFTTIGRTWLAGERGVSLARLGHVEEARAILRPVLASLGPTSERDRLWLLAALAGVHAELGEAEEACLLARSALMGASRMHLSPVVRLVAGLRPRLERHRRSLAVQELDEHLRMLGEATARSAATT